MQRKKKRKERMTLRCPQQGTLRQKSEHSSNLLIDQEGHWDI